jgi:hypothetical protein
VCVCVCVCVCKWTANPITTLNCVNSHTHTPVTIYILLILELALINPISSKNLHTLLRIFPLPARASIQDVECVKFLQGFTTV